LEFLLKRFGKILDRAHSAGSGYRLYELPANGNPPDAGLKTRRGPMLKTFAFAALVAVATVSAPAYAGLALNGMNINGVNLNGASLNGIQLNGLTINGISFNGLHLNGLSINGIKMNGLRTYGPTTSSGSLHLQRVTLPDGTVLTF
jgi:uncharacterized protein YjbI with pentapeptide repeats